MIENEFIDRQNQAGVEIQWRFCSGRDKPFIKFRQDLGRRRLISNQTRPRFVEIEAGYSQNRLLITVQAWIGIGYIAGWGERAVMLSKTVFDDNILLK